jgi:Xaa-Pro aminopeptidase
MKLMLFTACPQIGDKRGKGPLNYLFGYNLNQHRIVYGSVPIDGKPWLIFPNGVSQGAKGVPQDVYRSAHGKPMGTELEKVFQEAGVSKGDRIGVVGLDQQMPVADYLYLSKKFPGVELFDATEIYDEVRSIKSNLEVEYLRKSNRIAELAFEELRRTVKVGMSIREAATSVFREMLLQGANFHDNSMLALWGSSGRCDPHIVVPESDEKLKKDHVFILSVELTSSEGYWVEFARIICFSRPSALGAKLASYAISSLEKAATATTPGTTGFAIYSAITEELQRGGFHQGHAPGHGIGLDVSEGPGVKPTEKRVVKDGMVMALHPHVLDESETNACYISNTYLIKNGRASPLSKLPLDVIQVS